MLVFQFTTRAGWIKWCSQNRFLTQSSGLSITCLQIRHNKNILSSSKSVVFILLELIRGQKKVFFMQYVSTQKIYLSTKFLVSQLCSGQCSTCSNEHRAINSNLDKAELCFMQFTFTQRDLSTYKVSCWYLLYLQRSLPDNVQSVKMNIIMANRAEVQCSYIAQLRN